VDGNGVYYSLFLIRGCVWVWVFVLMQLGVISVPFAKTCWKRNAPNVVHLKTKMYGALFHGDNVIMLIIHIVSIDGFCNPEHVHCVRRIGLWKRLKVVEIQSERS
jgi:hypothetical protein